MKPKTHADRDKDALDWLLQSEQPAARYFTLVELLDRKEDDPQVRSARSKIPRIGWAAEQLEQQRPKGYWEAHEPKNVRDWVDFLYFPKYTGTNWRALVLSDMGLDSSIPRIRKIANLIFASETELGDDVEPNQDIVEVVVRVVEAEPRGVLSPLLKQFALKIELCTS